MRLANTKRFPNVVWMLTHRRLDSGPTSKQHLVNVSCFLGREKHEKLVERFLPKCFFLSLDFGFYWLPLLAFPAIGQNVLVLIVFFSLPH